MTGPNFARLMDPARREHFVYRAYNEGGQLLYVGCTAHPKERWAEHKRWSRWAPFAVRFRVVGPYSYHTARQIERDALRDEFPLYGDTPQRKSERGRKDHEERLRIDAKAEALIRRGVDPEVAFYRAIGWPVPARRLHSA